MKHQRERDFHQRRQNITLYAAALLQCSHSHNLLSTCATSEWDTDWILIERLNLSINMRAVATVCWPWTSCCTHDFVGALTLLGAGLLSSLNIKSQVRPLGARWTTHVRRSDRKAKRRTTHCRLITTWQDMRINIIAPSALWIIIKNIAVSPYAKDLQHIYLSVRWIESNLLSKLSGSSQQCYFCLIFK